MGISPAGFAPVGLFLLERRCSWHFRIDCASFLSLNAQAAVAIVYYGELIVCLEPRRFGAVQPCIFTTNRNLLLPEWQRTCLIAIK